MNDDHDDLTLGHYIAILFVLVLFILIAQQTGRVPYQLW